MTADLTANFYFKPSFELGFDVRILTPRLNYFTAGAKGELKVSATVLGQASLSASGSASNQKKSEAKGAAGAAPAGGSGEEFSLAKMGPYKGPVVYGIPTTFVVRFIAECSANAAATAKVTVAGGLEAMAEFYVKYKHDQGWFTEKDYSFDKWTNLTVESDGQVVLQCSVGPKVEWLFADIGGVFVRLQAIARGTLGFEFTCPSPGDVASSGAPPGTLSTKGQVGGKLSIGARADLKVVELSVEKGLWEDYWTLWEKTWNIKKGLGYCLSGCEDAQKSFKETGSDCGGGVCDGCAKGGPCNGDKDCAYGLMCIGGTCAQDPCYDNTLNNGEVDVDCSGPCEQKCAPGKKCNVSADCDGVCHDSGKCVEVSCFNDFWDKDFESAKDCGGECAAKCGTGTACLMASDCAGNSH